MLDSEADDQKDDDTDAEVERQYEEREQAILGVLRGMQPGSLAEAAQRAARQRCLALTDTKARNTCLGNAK
jgi:hypothetical protein